MSRVGRIFGLITLLVGALTIGAYSRRLPFLDMPVGDAAFFLAWGRDFAASAAVGPFWLAPGYAAALSLVRGPGSAGALPLALVQLVLLTLSVLMTVGLAERWFDRRTAAFAGVLLCGSAGPIFLLTKPLPEIVGLFLCVIFLALALEAGGSYRSRAELRRLERLRADGAPRPRATQRENRLAGAAGFVGGLAAAVTPWVGYAIVMTGVGVLRAGIRGDRGRTPALWFVLGACLALTPTAVHNARHGALALIQTGGGFEAWLALAPGGEPGLGDSGLEGGAIPLSLRSARADSLERAELGAPLDPGHRESWWRTRAMRALLENPGAAVDQISSRWRHVAAAAEPDAAGSWTLERARLPWLNLLLVPFPAILLLGLLGLALAAGLGSERRGISAVLDAPVALLLAALIGIGLSPDPPRGRLLLLPVLALFGGHALAASDALWQRNRRRAVVLLAALVAGTALLWRVPGASESAAARAGVLYLAAGNGFEAAGRDSAAGQAWRRALVYDPTRAEASLRLSQLALRGRDLAGAIALLEAAGAQSPRNFNVRNNLGILYHQALRYDAAERELVAASALRPGEAGPWFYRGLMAQRAGSHALADSLYGAAVACDPRFLGGWIRRVENQLAAGNRGAARAWADSAAARGVALPAPLAERLAVVDNTPGGVRN